jgi:hypothetical protein
MPEDLNLKLHRRSERNEKPGRALFVVLIAVLLICVLSLVVLLKGGGGEKSPGNLLSSGKLEELALKFEKLSLSGAAARAWIDYIESARPGAEERARIWYRVGGIYQDGGDYERALEAYYRSEAIARLDEIEGEISRRTAECLENLGKFAALRFELEGRTAFSEGDSTGGSDVLAEIGSWKITGADLDMMIEAEVDVQLSQLAVGLTPDERRIQKEKLLENVLKQGERGKWLERFIAEELLYRQARENRLYEEPDVRTLIRNVERKLLAQKLLEGEYASRVTVMPNEIREYYDLHAEEFEKDGKREPFEQVRDQIYVTVRMQKEMEVQRQVLEMLKDRYDVVIHSSKLLGR